MASTWEQRFSEFVKRLLALRESTALEALPDLMPVLPVLDPLQPCARLPRGELLVSAVFDVTAAAAQFPTWWLENPSGSNALLVVERAWVFTPTAQEVRFGAGANAAPGAPVAIATDDERRPNTATRMRRVTESAVAAIQGRQFYLRDLGGIVGPLPVSMQQVLPPGFSLQLQGQAVASRLFGFLQGYERSATPGELASF